MNISPDVLSIVVFALISFVLTIVALPEMIKILKSSGMVVKDYYKRGGVCVPTNGGLLIGLVVLVMLSASVIFCNSMINFIIVYIAVMYAIFGILDDRLRIRNRWLKIFFPYFLSYPIALILQPHAMGTISHFAGMTHATVICFYYIIAPIYVMVVANMVNMHSGFNGLQSGLSSIVFFFLLLKSVMVGQTEHLTIFAAFFGANLAFWTRNRYPSSIFEGNIGAMLIGAAMGTFIVFQGFLISGFIMLLPHTINFLMYFYWRVRRNICHRRGIPPGEYDAFKFGRLQKDGIIKVPNRLTLKWLPPYYYPMTEREIVMVMHALTATTCAIALYMPY
ncbi:MAG: UDP-N-acetylglucosamine-1-phosphate transferase [Methanosarcinales archaeon]|nr:MAG: UDP-N-acetylglucosamine-1-phosphate transferase [Methanosarcinales archaeon]